jgi:hypothetical protein
MIMHRRTALTLATAAGILLAAWLVSVPKQTDPDPESPAALEKAQAWEDEQDRLAGLSVTNVANNTGNR